TLVVVVKYLTFIMRADNHGEGGILALFALVLPGKTSGRKLPLLLGLGLFGAALLYGDGMITPAISVLSAIEGLEVVAPALHADMGHFGRGPIRAAWYAIVLPGLLLNYFGQGALLVAEGAAAVDNPFFALVPHALLIPMVIVATMATVIASQALISGVFSIT